MSESATPPEELSLLPEPEPEPEPELADVVRTDMMATLVQAAQSERLSPTGNGGSPKKDSSPVASLLPDSIGKDRVRRAGIERGADAVKKKKKSSMSAKQALIAKDALAAMRVPRDGRTQQHVDALIKWVESVRFFRDNTSSHAMRKEIGMGVKPVDFAKGSVVCLQGDRGDEFFVILEGEVEVAVNGHSVGTLDAGQGFGDRALSTTKASLRTASIVALKPTVLASLHSALYHTLVDSVPQSEMTKFGGLLTLGQVEFADGRTVRNTDAPTLEESRQAKVLRLETMDSEDFAELEPDAQLQRVKMLRDTVDVMKYTWRMPMPNVIFSVTGGATPFTLRPKIERLFEKTLLNATRSTTGLIVTGGANIGVMKLVGDSIARSGRMETCLGIMPWGVCHGRNAFTKDGPMQQELKVKLPGLTVRVDGLPENIVLGDEDDLGEQFSKFGTVIGVTISTRTGLLSASPGLPRQDVEKLLHETRVQKLRAAVQKKYAAAQQSGAEPAAGVLADGNVWCYISYSTPQEAAICCQHRLKLTFEEVEGRAGGTVEAVVTSTMYDETKDIGLFGVHEGRVLSSRGTTSLPFRYTGKAIPEEGNPGAQMDRNHSHYILLDDATSNRFGREVAFRGELLDFLSYRYDVSGMTVEHIVEQIRQRQTSLAKRKTGGAKKKWKKAVKRIDLTRALGGTIDGGASSVGGWVTPDMQRSVPVVAVVYNGGPNTMATVMLHIDCYDPVLIIKGSGRAADLFTNWKALMDELGQHADVFRSSIKEQVLRKQEELIRQWLFNDEGVKPPDTPEAEEALRKRIEQFHTVLDKICGYHLFKIVDIRVESKHDLELMGTEGTNNPLLRHVLNAIFDSSTVKASAKLPLAIKYKDHHAVRTVLDRQGIHFVGKGEELAADTRMLVYAAYSGHAAIVSELLEAGADVCQLDQLIMLEIQPELDIAAKRMSSTRNLQPPKQWMKDRRIEHAKVQANSYADRSNARRGNWSTLSRADQLKLIEDEWNSIEPGEQAKLCQKYSKVVTWDKLGLVNGWTFRVMAHHVEAEEQGGGPDATDAESHDHCNLFVRGVGGEFENEDTLTAVFAPFGEVVAVVVRHRTEASKTPGQQPVNTSWALVTMESKESANEAIAAAGTLPQPLRVEAYNETVASSSTGAMSAVEADLGEKAHLASPSNKLWQAQQRALDHTKLNHGSSLRVIGARRAGSGTEVDLIQMGMKKPGRYTGQLISTQRAQKLISAEMSGWRSDEMSHDAIWLLVHEEGVGEVLLRQVVFDEVSSCLPLDQSGRFQLSRLSAELSKATQQAFAPWLPGSGDDGVEAKYDVLSSPLHPMHRLFWAVASGREELAQLLFTRSSHPLACAFLGAYTHAKEHSDARGDGANSIKRKEEWDRKAVALLQAVAATDSAVSIGIRVDAKAGYITTIFNEYITFGKDEEDLLTPSGEKTEYARLTAEQKEENSKMRSALSLMGCDEQVPTTRVDLALAARNKLFLSHSSCASFLDSLWLANHTGRGEWLDYVTEASCQAKFRSHVLGYTLFLLLFAYVYVRMAWPSEMQTPNVSEWVLWAWVLSIIVDETHQAMNANRIEGVSILRAYLRTSGNLLDFIINVNFTLAAVCRAVAQFWRTAFDGTGIDPPGVELCKQTVACDLYTAMMAMLGVNFIICCFRLLYMFSVIKSIGVLLITFQDILKKDIRPWRERTHTLSLAHTALTASLSATNCALVKISHH